MASPEDTSDKDTILITPKQVGMAVAVIAAIVGAVPLGVVRTSPDIRSDPFTGTQGRELQRQIDAIIKRDDELRQSIAECESNMREHLSWGRDLSIKQAQRDATQDAQIQELFRRLP